MDGDAFEVTIETPPQRRLLVMAEDFDMTTRDRIPALWQGYDDSGQGPDPDGDGAVYGVSWGMTDTGAFRYGVGHPGDGDAPDGFEPLDIPAGPHAVLRRFGPLDGLPAAFDWLFQTWLPESGHTQRDAPVVERYPDDPRNTESARAFEIWVPVTEEAG